MPIAAAQADAEAARGTLLADRLDQLQSGQAEVAELKQRLARQELGLTGQLRFAGGFDWNGKKLALSGELEAAVFIQALVVRVGER